MYKADNGSAVQAELIECDNTDYGVDESESKTVLECSELKTGKISKAKKRENYEDKGGYFSRISLTYEDIHRICFLVTIGLLSWGLACSIWCSSFSWGRPLFRLALTAALGYVSGQLLERLTSLPALLGMILAGIALGNAGFLNIQELSKLDAFLRQIYPVIILGKSALGVDYLYLRANIRRLLAFGVIPWGAEVAALAVCVRYILLYPWRWGFLLGSVFASLSPAVVMPVLLQQHSRNLAVARDLPRLVGTGGGIDTTLSVGVYGLLFSAMFSKEAQAYVIFKASATLFVGVAIGVCWGYFSSLVPNKKDPFLAESRLLVVLLGGLFANCGTLAIGWGGTGGVAVLVCNMTAAHFWRKSGWKININPVATAYRVLWNIFEPMLFAYTGAHLQINEVSTSKLAQILGVLIASLSIRLFMTYLVGWGCGFRVKERIFICITWIPKAIVEAVLAPTALDAVLSSSDSTESDMWCAKTNIHIILMAILVTTPVGYILTALLGPVLLSSSEPRDRAKAKCRRLMFYRAELADGDARRRVSGGAGAHVVWSTSRSDTAPAADN